MDLKNITSTSKIKPPRIIIYGTPGIGKSTWAAQSTKPVFLDIEGGLDFIKVPRIGVSTIKGCFNVLDALAIDDHDFKTLVIDSLDWLEKLIHLHICNEEGVKNMMEVPFGKAYQSATGEWKKMIDKLTILREKRDMTIILVSHVQIKKFEDPSTDDYDRYSMKLHKSGEALITEFCDCIFFACQKVYVTKKDGGFGRQIIKPTTGNERIIRTVQHPAFMAKNRYNLPDEIPLDFNAFRKSFINQTKKAKMPKEKKQ